MDNCDSLASSSPSTIGGRVYLESAAQAEDTVVGLLGVEALESGVHNVVLLGEQVVGPVRQSVSSGPWTSAVLHSRAHCIQCIPHVPQNAIPSPSPMLAQGAAYLRPSCL